MRIRVITLWEVWASLMAVGAKKLETRSWAVKYRGPIGIHAAGHWTAEQADYFTIDPYRSALAAGGINSEADLHLGCVLTIGILKKIYRTEEVRPRLTVEEEAFGNYEAGRYAWNIEVVYQLPKPIPARGARGLWFWDVPDNVAAKVRPMLSQGGG
jgi:hypothetical protein